MPSKKKLTVPSLTCQVHTKGVEDGCVDCLRDLVSQTECMKRGMRVALRWSDRLLYDEFPRLGGVRWEPGMRVYTLSAPVEGIGFDGNQIWTRVVAVGCDYNNRKAGVLAIGPTGELLCGHALVGSYMGKPSHKKALRLAGFTLMRASKGRA